MSYQERATVIASTQGNLAFEIIWRALRQQYPNDISRHDTKRLGRKGTLMVSGTEVDWDLFDEDSPETFDGNAMSNTMNDDDVTIDEDDMQNEPGLVAAFQNAQRTLVQTRNAIKRARMSRGLHQFRNHTPGSNKPNKPQYTPQSGVKSNYSRPSTYPQQSSSSNMVCVVCGGNHRVSTCPDRLAPAQSVEQVGNSHNFVFMAMETHDENTTTGQPSELLTANLYEPELGEDKEQAQQNLQPHEKQPLVGDPSESTTPADLSTTSEELPTGKTSTQANQEALQVLKLTKESRTAYVSLEEEITDYDGDEEKNTVPKGEKRAGTGEEHVEQHGDDHHIPHQDDRHEIHETGPNTVLVEFYSQPGKIKEVRMNKAASFRSLLPVVRVEGKPSH